MTSQQIRLVLVLISIVSALWVGKWLGTPYNVSKVTLSPEPSLLLLPP